MRKRILLFIFISFLIIPNIAHAAKDTRIAWLTGTNTTTGTNFNVTTNPNLEFSAGDYDASFFSWSAGTNPDRLTVKVAGDYLVCLTVPMYRTDTNANRSRVQNEIHVNGVKATGGVTRCSYIRLNSGHSESSNHLNVLLEDLSVDDYITIEVGSAPGNDMTDATYPTVVSGQFGLYVEYITHDETVFTATATQTNAGATPTNLNQAAAELEWTESRKDSGYTHNDGASPEDITLDAAGNYLVFVNVPWGEPTETQNNRMNIIGKILIGGIQITGGEFSQAYIRGDGHAVGGVDFDGSCHFAGVVTTASASQVLSVSVEQETSTVATVTVDGEVATIYIQKLPSSDRLYAGRATQVRTNVDDWDVNGAKSAAEWENDDIIDTNVYTHNTSSNEHQITVDEDGDYLLVFNGAYTSATQRANNRITVEVDTVEVTGAQTKTNYMRNSGGHNNASSTLVYLLDGLSANNVITVSSEREAANATTNDTVPAKLFLWKKERYWPLPGTLMKVD